MKAFRSIWRAGAVLAVAGFAVLAGASAAAAGEAQAARPADYRSWTHVKSMVVVDRTDALYGFHDVYANAAALTALKDGGAFREGAELAISIRELSARDGGTAQGKIIKVGYMKKDGAAAATGGWRYSIFGPEGKEKAIDPATACHACHAKAGAADCVFSRYTR